MEATIPKKRKKRVTRLTVHLDSKIVERLWMIRASTGKTLSSTAEEAFLRLFNDGDKSPSH